ncbi:Uncharacterised protein [Vibrio cholerae]|nr:Uncharacterised protein [Vibrio cholerae]
MRYHCKCDHSIDCYNATKGRLPVLHAASKVTLLIGDTEK